MVGEKYTSVRTIVEGIYRDNNVQEEVNFLDFVEWAAEALEGIGACTQYQVKSACLDLCDYRVVLPCDFHKQLSLSIEGAPLMPATSVLGNVVSNASQTDAPLINGQPVTFPQLSTNVSSTDFNDPFTYIINDNFITSNLKTGTLLISYLGIPVDDDGFPLIPENYYYIKAIKLYITYMLDRMQWRQGKVADKVYNESKNEWQWYTQAARSAALMPGIDTMENFKNQWLKIMPNLIAHSTFFQNLSAKERIRNQPSNRRFSI